MKSKYSKNKTAIPKRVCIVCGKFTGGKGWGLFKWSPTPGTNTMTIPHEDIEKRIVGVMCDSCHQIANAIN